MSVFDKWNWIKRNWLYILEEASQLDLVFVGGTALNLALFKEYRSSEDIYLYDPLSTPIGTAHEEKMIKKLSNRLMEKGLNTTSKDKRALTIGPNIKIEVFNDGTPIGKIQKKIIQETEILLFDIPTYAEMKMTSLLCRTLYDSRDLVDLFVIRKATGTPFSFPKRECDRIEQDFDERLQEIQKTTKNDLLIFQTQTQIAELPYTEFEIFKEWLYDGLSEFR